MGGWEVGGWGGEGRGVGDESFHLDPVVSRDVPWCPAGVRGVPRCPVMSPWCPVVSRGVPLLSRGVPWCPVVSRPVVSRGDPWCLMVSRYPQLSEDAMLALCKLAQDSWATFPLLVQLYWPNSFVLITWVALPLSSVLIFLAYLGSSAALTCFYLSLLLGQFCWPELFILITWVAVLP